MTLHNVTENSKKVAIGAGAAIVGIIVLVLIFQLGGFIKNIIAPPRATEPEMAFGQLPVMQFPESGITRKKTYTINTITGELPQDFPDRLHVYKIKKPTPNLLNLEKAKEKIAKIGITDELGQPVPETSLGGGKYEWSEKKELRRKITLDIVSFNFIMDSGFLTNLTVRGGQNLSDQAGAKEVSLSFLEKIDLLPEDIDPAKTKEPKLFSIQNNSLAPATSLATTQVIRVDLFQKDLEYEMDTGFKDTEKLKIKAPIVYPNPPFSTMSFWIASGRSFPEVVRADFTHKEITFDEFSTYPVKTPNEAFEELKDGKAYIASFQGLDDQILITNIFLAYYIDKNEQQYLMPVIVFEGQDEFKAYVPAIKSQTNP